MCSDADPAVALDPKLQHRELTKPDIYCGIASAVSSLLKTNSTLCMAMILLENSVWSFSTQTNKIPSDAIFWIIKALSVKAAVFTLWLYHSLHLSLNERNSCCGDSTTVDIQTLWVKISLNCPL